MYKSALLKIPALRGGGALWEGKQNNESSQLLNLESHPLLMAFKLAFYLLWFSGCGSRCSGRGLCLVGLLIEDLR